MMIRLPRYCLYAIRHLTTGEVYRKSGGWDTGIFKTWTTAAGVVTFIKQYVISEHGSLSLKKAGFWQEPGSYSWNQEFGKIRPELLEGNSAGSNIRFWRDQDYVIPTADEVLQWETYNKNIQDYPEFLDIAQDYAFMVVDLVSMTQELINVRKYFESRQK